MWRPTPTSPEMWWDTWVNVVNDTPITMRVEYRYIYAPSGLVRTETFTLAPNEPLSRNVSSLLPGVGAADWVNQNARVIVTCDDGETACPATAANWFGRDYGARSTPRYAYQALPACR